MKPENFPRTARPCATAWVVIAAALACAPVAAAPGDGAGWTDDERKQFYHLAEGSEIFPIDWLAALKSSHTGKLFVENLNRFGLIDDPNGPLIRGTTLRLPIGMTAAPTATLKVKMIGVNCAACHVGQITSAGKSLVIEGAPNMVNINDLYQEIFESVEHTLKHPLELIGFLERLAKIGAEDDPSKLLVAMLPGLKKGGVEAELEGIILQRLRSQLSGGAAAHGLADDYLKLAPSPGGQDAIALAKKLFEEQRQRAEKQLAGIKKLTEALANKGEDLKGDLGKALARLGVERLAMIEARVAFLRRLKEIAPGQAQFRAGPGRVDAFVTARNLLFDSEDIILPNSPVSFPHLWGLSKLGWLHWDGNTNSIMERNVGQSLGLGAVAVRKTNHSTVLPKNLHVLEGLAKKIPAPAWPVMPLGAKAIDEELANKGKALYGEYCAACHDRQEGTRNVKGSKVYPVKRLDKDPADVKLIGTDPRRAENFAAQLHDGTEFAAGLAETLRKIKHQAFKDAGLTAAEGKAMDLQPESDIKWLTTGGYVARPLAGIWASAPYLHNGSVPTLDDLLKPAAERPPLFPVGQREYDFEKLGYVTDSSRIPREQINQVFNFNVDKPGNSNAGHEYGDKRFNADERRALLEYLKTLK